MHTYNRIVGTGCEEESPRLRLLQTDHEGSHRTEEEGDKHGRQVLHADNFVVGRPAEVAPQPLVLARQIQLFLNGWLTASKRPFEDPVKGSNAHEEEDHPGCVDGRGNHIVVGNLVRAVRSSHTIYYHASDSSCNHAKHDSRKHARKEHLHDAWPFGSSHRCTTGCTAHYCPPWAMIQELKSSALTTLNDSHMYE